MGQSDRREFLGSVGQGMLITSLGATLAGELDANVFSRGTDCDFPVSAPRGDLEDLIRRMQRTPAAKLQPILVAELKSGTALKTLVAAGALANARTFGGMDYQGYHAFMALKPAYELARRMPRGLQALPVLKVLYRNTDRIHRAGGGKEQLQPIDATTSKGRPGAETLRQIVRDRDMQAAESEFARRCKSDTRRAFNDLLWLVQDGTDVHRTVLPWRAWDMLQLTGEEHAHTLLRQSLRYCVDSEKRRVAHKSAPPGIRAVLPKLLDTHKLLQKTVGAKQPGDAWIEELSLIVFGPDRERAADAVAAALAEGFAPDAVGEAIALAANQLLLHSQGDPNRRGGVHGASVGVHASDAAHAWRHLARVGNPRNQVASLVVAAYHTAGQTHRVDKQPIAYVAHSAKLATKDPQALLREIEDGVKNRNQVGVCGAVHRYGQLGHPPAPVFQLLAGFAVSEDGALHAEKYFQTASQEFRKMRPAFRWRQLIALARVTASEFGEPAPGVADARKLLEA